MVTPGFTAEYSLRQQTTPYCANSSLATVRSAAGLVLPQQCNPFSMSLCVPVLSTCAYGWCWWNMGEPWGKGACRGCMNACIDAHMWFDPTTAGLCKGCATSWPCP